MSRKTRRSIASSGAYIFLIITGAIWLVGFLANQFLPGSITVYIWIGISLVGTAIAVSLGIRLGRRVRNPSVSPYVKRIVGFWLLLILYCIAVITIAQPLDSQQVTMGFILENRSGIWIRSIVSCRKNQLVIRPG